MLGVTALRFLTGLAIAAMFNDSDFYMMAVVAIVPVILVVAAVGVVATLVIRLVARLMSKKQHGAEE